MRPSIAVLGGAGFVGRRLLVELERTARPATSIVRNAPEFSLDGAFHRGARVEDLPSDERFDVVVNLAYPSGAPLSFPDQNRKIVDTIQRLLKPGGHVVHVSTQAVFGLALDRPVHVGPVRAHRDVPYVEAKVAAEHLLAGISASIDIVRLGNVWGPGSATWTVPLVHRLLTGRPVGVRGVAGFSNVTDVGNVASYLSHLIERPAGSGVRFHHLAECSSVPWERWVAGLARELQVDAVYADGDVLSASDGVVREIGRVMRGPWNPRGLYRTAAGERTLGSWTRSILGALPEQVVTRLRGDGVIPAGRTSSTRDDATFLAIVSARQEFKPHLDPAWRPPVSEVDAMQRVADWLRAA